MQLEQCVQSKHREITNYYINITVAFIASSISDLVFLEGQSLYTNSHPLCVLFFFLLQSLGGIKKNLGIPLAVFQEKKPFPPKFPRNRRSDGGRFVVEQSCTTPTGSLITPYNSGFLSGSHPCGNNSKGSKFPSNPPCSSSCGSILIQIYVHRSSDQRLQEISALTVRCDSSSLDK